MNNKKRTMESLNGALRYAREQTDTHPSSVQIRRVATVKDDGTETKVNMIVFDISDEHFADGKPIMSDEHKQATVARALLNRLKHTSASEMTQGDHIGGEDDRPRSDGERGNMSSARLTRLCGKERRSIFAHSGDVWDWSASTAIPEDDDIILDADDADDADDDLDIYADDAEDADEDDYEDDDDAEDDAEEDAPDLAALEPLHARIEKVNGAANGIVVMKTGDNTLKVVHGGYQKRKMTLKVGVTYIEKFGGPKGRMSRALNILRGVAIARAGLNITSTFENKSHEAEGKAMARAHLTNAPLLRASLKAMKVNLQTVDINKLKPESFKMVPDALLDALGALAVDAGIPAVKGKATQAKGATAYERLMNAL